MHRLHMQADPIVIEQEDELINDNSLEKKSPNIHSSRAFFVFPS